jgi:hypothetical protein
MRVPQKEQKTRKPQYGVGGRTRCCCGGLKLGTPPLSLPSRGEGSGCADGGGCSFQSFLSFHLFTFSPFHLSMALFTHPTPAPPLKWEGSGCADGGGVKSIRAGAARRSKEYSCGCAARHKVPPHNRAVPRKHHNF